MEDSQVLKSNTEVLFSYFWTVKLLPEEGAEESEGQAIGL